MAILRDSQFQGKLWKILVEADLICGKKREIDIAERRSLMQQGSRIVWKG